MSSSSHIASVQFVPVSKASSNFSTGPAASSFSSSVATGALPFLGCLGRTTAILLHPVRLSAPSWCRMPGSVSAGFCIAAWPVKRIKVLVLYHLLWLIQEPPSFGNGSFPTDMHCACSLARFSLGRDSFFSFCWSRKGAVRGTRVCVQGVSGRMAEIRCTHMEIQEGS